MDDNDDNDVLHWFVVKPLLGDGISFRWTVLRGEGTNVF